jgi:hypothetical protein
VQQLPSVEIEHEVTEGPAHRGAILSPDYRVISRGGEILPNSCRFPAPRLRLRGGHTATVTIAEHAHVRYESEEQS